MARAAVLPLLLLLLVLPHRSVESNSTDAHDALISVFLPGAEDVGVFASLVTRHQIDLWRPESLAQLGPGSSVQCLVGAEHTEVVLASLGNSSIPYNVTVSNVEEEVTKQATQLQDMSANVARGKVSYYDTYHPLDEIYRWMEEVAKHYSSWVSYKRIGVSHENRPLYVIKVGVRSSVAKPAVWIDCGIHAREWIAPAFCQYFVQHAVNRLDRSMMELLKHFDFYVLPVLNVDGYHYSWTKSRLWRKNRARSSHSACVGVDLNRNWNASWGGPGASADPCSQTFQGSRPESEPEVRAVAAFIRERRHRLHAYVTVHAYSQMLIFPYSYTEQRSAHHEELELVAQEVVQALRSVHGTPYRHGAGGPMLYMAAGGSDDWAHDLGIKYSFTFELRDTGRYGFLLPANFIRATCQETMEAVKVIALRAMHDPELA
ncbi:carboxypeptidase B2-like [Petromyzon marinus]|uniref:Carboxypeptidase B2-like n=1 Tax=Petromyzon marinus TaxID=7757 RepID=A0AAJ7XF03_PETMA|nr:carboxypeptidase B2-like [Petromyzon marinus]